MSEQRVKVRKKEDHEQLPIVDRPQNCATISSEAYEFYLSKRHAVLMELAALDKLLGLKRKCRHCRNEL